MLKALLLAIAMLITSLVNGVIGLLNDLPVSTQAQSQAALQQSQRWQENIKPNLKSLPKNQTGISAQSNKVVVSAGDTGVLRNSVQSAIKTINSYALPVLRDNFNLSPVQDVNLVLFSSKTSYANALQQAGVESKLIPSLVSNSGGVTVGADIWIPLYALQGKADMANVLTHELTHAVLNQMGIGDNLPTWIDEGTAWYNGLAAQEKVNPTETKLDMNALQNGVLAAARAGRLYPLSASEQDIINAPYNVEYEDYLAVNYLVKNYGKSTFAEFLQECAKQSANSSFKDHYNMGLNSFESSVYQSLTNGK